jgi:hypothetical protein
MRQMNGKWFFANPETLSDWIIGLEEQFDILITGEILKNYQPSVTAI